MELLKKYLDEDECNSLMEHKHLVLHIESQIKQWCHAYAKVKYNGNEGFIAVFMAGLYRDFREFTSEVKNKLIENLGLSVRSFNVCQSLGVKDLYELSEIKVSSLRKQRGVGMKTIRELRESLADHGLRFKL